MAQLINAPHLADQIHEPYSDIFILAGRKAWQAWDNGKGEEWLLLCSLIHGLDSTIKPVILAEKQLENISSIRIVKEDQQSVKLVQYGELAQAEITAICQNLAKNSDAIDVKLLDSTAQTKEDLSAYIQRLRNDKETADLAEQLAPPEKVKDSDWADKKARALSKYLGFDFGYIPLTKETLTYNGISWDRYDEGNLISGAVRFFEENNLRYNANSIELTVKTLKIQSTILGSPKQGLLAFKNGVLDRKTLEFSEHSKENWLLSHIPHDYINERQPTPNFDKWLDWVSDGNQSKQNAILAAFYMILTNRYNWQMYLEVTGHGGSGKSVFAKLAKMLVGEQNISAASLEDFEDPKEMDGFEDKLLLICSEQQAYGGKGSGLKRVTGGDDVRIDKKYISRFTTVIPAVILVVNNEPTKFTDRTGAIERRRVIFSFDKIIPEKDRDPDLMDKIASEISAIIYKIIHSFKHPLDAKQLLEQQQKSDEALKIKINSDHITLFCSYLYTTEEENGLGIGNAKMRSRFRTHLYPTYLEFVDAINHEYPISYNNFTSAIKQGLIQNRNPIAFKSKKSTGGVFKTNVHFKNFDEFFNEYLQK